MSILAALTVLAFVVLWWLFSAALFLGVIYAFDRDEAVGFIHDLWRWMRL